MKSRNFIKKLIIPPEPIEIKKRAKEAKQRDPEWRSDSLMIWFKGIASYFWKYWKQELVLQGIDWPGFEILLSLWKDEFVMWSRDRLDWKELVKEIKENLPEKINWVKRRRSS